MDIYVPSAPPIRLGAIWTIKERLLTPITRRPVWVPAFSDHNLFTYDGLTYLASAFSGVATAPGYLVIDNFFSTITDAGTLAIGSTTVHTAARVDKPGDTSIVLGLNTANEETRTFSAVTGTGPYAYTIAATTKTHANGDKVVRAAAYGDTVATIQGEVQYSPVALPGKRSPRVAFYSSGSGNGTMQFFITGSQAVTTWASLGLSESDTVGVEHLHSHLTSGFVHSTGVDVQVEVSVTITN